MHTLYQFIVPLAFLAIWALTTLFNRETQPIPPRTNRPNGPRPVPSTLSSRPLDRRPEPSPRDPLGARSTATRSAASASRPGARPVDDILILEPTGRPASSSSRPGSSAPRRGAKVRPAALTPPRRVETPTPRNLTTSSLDLPSTPPSIQSLGLHPLSLPPSPLLTTPNDEAAKTQAGRALVVERDSFSSADIRRLVQTPARLREAFILSELLAPPISRRAGLDPRNR